MTGTRDILLKVVATDLKAFDRFLEDHLVHVPGIRATRSSFSLRTMVMRDVLPVAESRGLVLPGLHHEAVDAVLAQRAERLQPVIPLD